MKRIFCASFFLFMLLGCTKIWYLKIIDTTNPQFPVFGFSDSQFYLSGTDLHYIYVFEADFEGKKIKDKWSITPKSDAEIKYLKYGTLPKGWREDIKAEPLELDKWYCMTGRYFFKIYKEDNKTKAKLITDKDYLTGNY